MSAASFFNIISLVVTTASTAVWNVPIMPPFQKNDWHVGVDGLERLSERTTTGGQKL